MRAGRVHVGTSGYQYDDWRGRFYPVELPTAEWLSFYARHFATVEINNTFYNLPARHVFERWAAGVPAGFRFALKLSRYATHFKRLLDPAQPLAAFLARAEPMGAKLGPILVQLPPRWKVDPPRLDGFLAAAPRRHRWVIEVRDASWLVDAVYTVLAHHGAALCVHDLLPRHPRVATADFAYLRFHGTTAKYAGGYSPQHLTARAREIRAELADGRDVYVYFNNDLEGHAVADARTLVRLLRAGGSRGERPGGARAARTSSAPGRVPRATSPSRARPSARSGRRS
jgi:uncharacterized protein YecE (DUF72 family)